MKTILVVDCNNLCHIQRHAFGEDLSFEEEQTGVMWGFFNTVLRLAKQFHTNDMVFTWDSRTSARKEAFPAYKAQRHADRGGMTPGMLESEHRIYQQFHTLRDGLLPGFGFRHVLHCAGWEADDLMALVVGRVHNQYKNDARVVVVSTDKDMYQLLDRCDVFRPLPGKAKELLTRGLFLDRYGIEPDRWPEVRAYTGDPSDNIPGIKGVGEKTAVRFLQGKIKVDSAARKLIMLPESRERYRENLELIKLPYSRLLPVRWGDVGFQDHQPSGPFDLDFFLAMCDRYRFNSFLKSDKLREWRDAFDM